MAVAQLWNVFGPAGAAARKGSDPLLFRALAGQSPGIVAVRQFVRRIAAESTHAMLLGETGTGKQVVARNIHYRTNRGAGRFVRVDCRTIAASFSDIDWVDRGTLFLEEAGDLSLDRQLELVRVLENAPFGCSGDAARPALRIIATSHRDLRAMIAEKIFSQDLYDCFAVDSIDMPALRERREDIPLLIPEINARLERLGLAPRRISDRALRAMLAYDWPGNLRELSRLIEHCADPAANATIDIDQLPLRIRGVSGPVSDPVAGPDLRDSSAIRSASFEVERIELRGLLELLETRLVRGALDRSDGEISQAAQQLGLRPSALIEKMRTCGIEQIPAGSAEA